MKMRTVASLPNGVTEVNAQHSGDLEKIKPKTLVSIYCTQESIFSAPVFKDEVRAMELSMYLLQTSTWACKNVVDCLHWGKKWIVM